MNGAVHSRPSAYSSAALARLAPALAASALLHWALLSAPPLDTPWHGIASYPGDAPITVRLAPVPLLVPDAPVSPDPEARRMPRQAKPPGGSAGHLPSGHSPSGAEAPTLPPAPDPHYYPARDLDSYPRPLAPFQIKRTAGDGASEVRLEILIDERGIVQDMTFAGPAAPARVEEALRAALAATRFLPAQKDGHAVRSRIVLSVSFAGER
jgi:protein TonB